MAGLTKIAIILVVGAILGGVALVVNYLSPTKESKTMDPTNNNLVTAAAISPIDASAPAKTETATFALG